MANIKARRKLSDLYKAGVEVRFDGGPGKIAKNSKGEPEGKFLDEDGNPIPLGEAEVQMWIQAPSPLHRDMAMRAAQASRAKALVRAKREEDSEEHLTIMAFLADMSDETLIDYLLIQGSDERQAEAIREVLAEDEWKDMEAYRDAIREYDDSNTPMEELEQDPEWVALMELDAKFGDQVQERMRELTDTEREALEMRLQSGRGWLERKALEKRADMVGTQAFMAEYEIQMLYYACRDFDDNGVMFYESARELAGQPDEILSTIRTAMTAFINDATEAKNLSGAVSGSDSSELPNAPETSAASTPETASA